MDFLSVALGLLPAAGALTFLVKAIADYRELRAAKQRLGEAERNAFGHLTSESGTSEAQQISTGTAPDEVSRDGKLLAKQELSLRTEHIGEHNLRFEEWIAAAKRVTEPSAEGVYLSDGALFNLYSKQIETYQTETQARAGWSFIFALVAMTAGLGFVIWGGTVVFAAGGWQKVAAGSSISVIGGSISAFVTKTFLDVHRLSLLQLNRYFRQPVLNSYILTAQRLADRLEEPTARGEVYTHLIRRIAELIREDDELPAGAAARAGMRARATLRKKRRVSEGGSDTRSEAR